MGMEDHGGMRIYRNLSDQVIIGQTNRESSSDRTDSYISSRLFACVLFITLVIEAVRTSEKSVYFHETTRLYISQSCHPFENNLVYTEQAGVAVKSVACSGGIGFEP
jgi:hypothetical protein